MISSFLNNQIHKILLLLIFLVDVIVDVIIDVIIDVIVDVIIDVIVDVIKVYDYAVAALKAHLRL